MTAPIGSGPYRVSAVKPGASVTLTRNPDYWGRDLPVNRGLWNFDEIRLDFYREANGQFEAFKRGLYDFRVENRAAALARRLRFSGRPQWRGDPRHHQDRNAAAVGISGVQHPPSGVFRHPRAPGADAAVRFRMDQPQLLLRALCALGELLRRLRTVGLWPRRRRSRARTAEALRLAHAARYSRRQLPPARQRRLGPRPHHAAQRADAAVAGRLRSRRHGAAAALDQGALHLRNPGDDARPGADRAGLSARPEARRHRGLGARGRRRPVRPAPARLRFRHDPEPLGSVAVAGQRAVVLLGQRGRRHPGHAQLHGRQGPRHRRHDRGHAGGARASRFRLGGAGAGPGPDVGLLRYPAV